jgi:hypothetical protein
MRILLLAALACSLSLSMNAQGFFKPLPKPGSGMRAAMVGSSVFGTNAWNLRPVVGAVMYTLPGNQGMTGAGISYQLDTYDAAAQSWQSVITFNLLVYTGVKLSAPGKQLFVGVGPSVGFLNDAIMVGAVYDGNQVSASVSYGINFN